VPAPSFTKASVPSGRSPTAPPANVFVLPPGTPSRSVTPCAAEALVTCPSPPAPAASPPVSRMSTAATSSTDPAASVTGPVTLFTADPTAKRKLPADTAYSLAPDNTAAG
jgi:hypothetical protein